MNKLLLVLVISLLVLGLIPIGSTVDINGVKLQSSGIPNLTVTTNTSIDFSTIKLTSTYIQLNDTKINGTYPNTATMTVMFLADDIPGKAETEECMNFFMTMTAGSATVNLSGFVHKFGYNVKREGVSIATPSADSDGFITFTTTVGTDIHYGVFRGDTTSQWIKYYGDGTGTNFTLNTFDIVKIVLDDGAGTILFNMSANQDWDYSAGRTFDLIEYDYGYNFTGWIPAASTTLSAENTSIGLTLGYFMALWNETTYGWNFWISNFGFTNKNIHQYDVIITKILEDRSWIQP